MAKIFKNHFQLKFLAAVLFVAFGIAIIGPHTPVANAATCNTVGTGSVHSYAGLIVQFKVKKKNGDSTGILGSDRTGSIRVNVATRGGTYTPPGNVVKLGSGPEGVAQRLHDKTFYPRSAGETCPGKVVLEGQGNGNWAIDCDVSRRPGGKPQPIEVTASGTPSGFDTGGSWTASSPNLAPKNGVHTTVTLTYKEPRDPPLGELAKWRANGNTKIISQPHASTHEAYDYETVTFNHTVKRTNDYPAIPPEPNKPTRPTRNQGESDAHWQNRLDNYNDNLNKYRDKVEKRRQIVEAINNANNSANNTNVRIYWEVYRLDGGYQDGVVPGSQGNLGSNYNRNSTYFNQKAPHLSAGDTYCEYVYYTNDKYPNGYPDFSDGDCVDIKPKWHINAANQYVTRVDNALNSSRPTGDSAVVAGPTTGDATYGDAWVGENYKFHAGVLTNGGPDWTDQSIQVWSLYYPYSGGVQEYGRFNTWAGFSPGQGIYEGEFTHTTGSIPAAAADGKYCHRLQWQPAAYNNPGVGQTGAVCVHVPYYYQLHPRVDVSSEPIVQQGTALHIDPQVVLNARDGGRGAGNRWNTCANSFNWELTVTAQKPDTPTVKEHVPGYDQSGSKGARAICPDSSAQALSSGESINTTVFPAGTRLCGHLEVWDETESGGRGSVDKCTIVVKAPKVQFWNSDVNAGRHFQQADNNPTCGQRLDSLGNADIKTSGPPTSVASQNLYGAWVEYGAFASGDVSSFGSAAQNKTGTFSVSPTGQRLTFGNDGQLGQFNYSNWCIPNYEKLYEPQRGQNTEAPDQAGSSVNLSSLDGNSYYQATSTGTVTLTHLGDIAAGKKDITLDAPNAASVVLRGGTVKSGVRLVIHTKGTVKIDGDIKYTASGYSNIDAIPRIIVVADGQVSVADGQQGIVVKDEVTQIDAWLITHKNLYTCTTKPTSFTYSGAKCGQQLTMNGPVAANALNLRRTFGADISPGVPLKDRGPAEVFNLNPDSLLGSYSAAQRDYFIDVYQRDLPPRY